MGKRVAAARRFDVGFECCSDETFSCGNKIFLLPHPTNLYRGTLFLTLRKNEKMFLV